MRAYMDQPISLLSQIMPRLATTKSYGMKSTVDSARRHDILQVNEAPYIQTTDNHFNRDVRIEVPQCWPALLNLHK